MKTTDKPKHTVLANYHGSNCLMVSFEGNYEDRYKAIITHTGTDFFNICNAITSMISDGLEKKIEAIEIGKDAFDKSEGTITAHVLFEGRKVSTPIDIYFYFTDAYNADSEKKSVWDFVETFYPDYTHSDIIAREGDLSKIIDGEMDLSDTESAATQAWHEHDEFMPNVVAEHNDIMVDILQKSIENFYIRNKYTLG